MENKKQKKQRNHLYEELTECSPIGYFIGVIDGDGSASIHYKNKRRYISYIITLGAHDKDFIDFFLDCIYKITKVKPTKRYEERITNFKKSNKQYLSKKWRVRFNSKALYDLYQNQRLNYIKKYPIQYLQGVFDSEGCVFLNKHKKPRICIGMHNLEIITHVKNVLFDNNIRSSNIYQRGECYSLKLSIDGSILFSKKLGLHIKRKQQRLLGNTNYFPTEVYRDAK